MTDDSGNRSEISTVGGTKSESRASKERADGAVEPSVTNELFHVLADRRRRYVLHCLEESETPMALTDIVDELVHWENESLSTAVDRERIHISLYHCHLPKLADLGLVSYDKDQKTVEVSEDCSELPFPVSQMMAEEYAQ